MPLTRGDKQEILDEYGAGLADARHAFLLGFKGISVPQVTELRARIRQRGASYVVVKNTLALRAVAGKPLAQLGDHFSGPTAVAYSPDDPVALAKVLTAFAKDTPALEFKAGLVDGQPIAGTRVAEIAALPSRQELITKLVFLLQSPIVRFARVLAALPQQFVSVLDQIRAQRAEQS